ncbi:MAG TPA: universal stress protein [Solirubrobacteraceae bacterium]|nr:universal stress protein [Solirubrobacteraceae bacterium]
MSPYEFTNVLVAIDGSDEAAKALDCALSICTALEANLTVLAVEGKLPAYAASLGEVDEVKREKDEFFDGVLHAARYSAEQRGVSVRTDLVPGHTAGVIVHYAVAHAHDLIVVAHHSHLLGDVLLGSTADRVAHHAPCPVMVVR